MRTKRNRAGCEVQVRWKDETFECAVTCPVSRESREVRAACRRSATSVRFAFAKSGSELPHSIRFARFRHGFTLIELLVVMGIISILAALVFPTIYATRKQTQRNIAWTEMASIQAAIVAYQTA